MFSNVLIIASLIILNRHVCSSEMSRCSPETYPVTPDWVFEDETLPPANLTQNLTLFENGTGWLNVFINSQREDFNLTLLANPFVNGSEYPELNTSDYNLRQFYTTCRIFKVDEWDHFYYRKIFTGWYYLVMTNREGKRWKHEPRFYETTYPFIDTRVQLIRKDEEGFKPENTDTTMSYYVELRVPLDCIVVRVALYEHKENIDGAIKHIEHGRIPPTQSCWIKNIGENPYLSCDLVSHIHVDVSGWREMSDDTYNNTWTVYMVWKNLTRGGGYYYLDYSGHDLTKCEKEFGAEAVETWRLIKDEIYVEIGEKHLIDEVRASVPNNYLLWVEITASLVLFVLLIILCYWALRWRRLKDLLKDEDKRGGIPKEPLKFIDEKESNQILLVYARGCPDFSKELEDFKQLLGKHCTGYKIRDVYAASEWTNVNKIGPPKWVEQQFEAGSIVIWFDTPQLRSRLSYPQKDHASDDFRDEAVPYALELARELYRDANTQYRRHFVVQMEAFKVEDHQGDPLQVLTPHTRYLLPGLFPVLCERLGTKCSGE